VREGKRKGGREEGRGECVCVHARVGPCPVCVKKNVFPVRFRREAGGGEGREGEREGGREGG